MSRYVSLAVFAAVTTLVSAPASAQSFNCRNASAPSERAICGNASLSGLDERMTELYDGLRSALAGHKQRDRLQDYQRNFLAARNACGRNVSCIKGAYLDQIEVLGARLKTADNDR